jgi:hypothetical protein
VLVLYDPDQRAGEAERVAVEHGATVLGMELARLEPGRDRAPLARDPSRSCSSALTMSVRSGVSRRSVTTCNGRDPVVEAEDDGGGDAVVPSRCRDAGIAAAGIRGVP